MEVIQARVSSVTGALRFKQTPAGFETQSARPQYVTEGGSVTRAMMLQWRGCCWTREIFVVNTSGWLCCDIPVCQPNPASKTPVLCNFNLLRNGKASLTDKRGSRSLEGLTGVMEKHLV